MALLNDILAWTQTLPKWQQHAAKLLLETGSNLAEADLVLLFQLLKLENGIEIENPPTFAPLSDADIPAEIPVGQTVTLCSLADLKHVNRLGSDQTLAFPPTGMTVIYGGNGSGKSGYARVLKRGCRSRDQSESVLPNALDAGETNAVPEATFCIEVGGVASNIVWKRDTTPDPVLSSISVFDSRSARSYLTAEQDVAYLPYGLDIVEALANKVLPDLTGKLAADIGAIDLSLDAFAHLKGETDVGKLILSLSDTSVEEDIEKLATLTENETKRLEELTTALAEGDPAAKAAEINLAVSRFKGLADRILKVGRWVDPDAVAKLKQLVISKANAEQVEQAAADALQAGEQLLPGTGEVVWKTLFEAARKYSIEVAFKDQEFPGNDPASGCPLCQQSLGDTGVSRLQRFENYIKDDAGKRADTERKTLKTATDKIATASLDTGFDQALADEVAQFDPALTATIRSFENAIAARRDGTVICAATGSWDQLPAFPDSPRAIIRKIAAAHLLNARALLKAADKGRRAKMETEKLELGARVALHTSLTAILELVAKMKRKAKLETCGDQLKTRPISDKSKEFVSAAVTDALKQAIDREFSALGVDHIKTRLKQRGERGKMYHQLLLDIPTSRGLDEILSEGEQRAVAIAAFLAELSLANHSCGIVLDDPVSSLDHWRRDNVAARLTEEAKIRQVIIFTHDTAFLGQLLDQIESAQIPNQMMFLEWIGDKPGCVSEGLPWDHQGYKARIDTLEKNQRALPNPWPIYPTEQQVGQVRREYNLLRATLERVIQDVVFCGVVKRYRDWIVVDSLTGVVGFTQTECDSIKRLHKKCCDQVTAHDPSSARTPNVPSPTGLKQDIDDLKTIVAAINQRKNAANTGPALALAPSAGSGSGPSAQAV